MTADDIDRATSFANAVERGRQEAFEEAWNMDELASDTEHLESLGFTAFGGHDGTDG
jgi:hypothetical protein